MSLPPAAATGWRAVFPPAQWLRAYRPAWLVRDAVAGVTLAAFAIPVALAYAMLAGLPPQYGAYGCLAGGLAYALFGSSRQMAMGPTSAISLLVGVSMSSLAADPGRAADLAALTALVVAALSLLAWALRLSSLVEFVSETILLGFKAGAGLTIALTQLPKLFGVKGGGTRCFERIAVLVSQLPATRVPVLAFGLAALALLIVGDKLLPGWPIALGVMALAIAALSWMPPDAGFSVVGEIPRGLPALHVPSFEAQDLEAVAPVAFACLLLAYVEGVSAARALAQRHGVAVDPRQELLGLGAANLAAGLSHAYPIAGGLSQSYVNDRAGAQTPLALVFASLTTGLCLIFLTGLLRNLPDVVLAAVVLVAVKGLLDVRELRHLWRVSRFEFGVALVALAGVLVLGIGRGVVLAALVSIGLLIRRAARPHVALLGRIPGSRALSDMEHSPDNVPLTGALAFRVEASLFYFNVEHVQGIVWQKIRAAGLPRLVVCDLSTSPRVDLAAARMLLKLDADLAAAGIALRVASARAQVREVLHREGLPERTGYLERQRTAADLVDDFETGAGSRGRERHEPADPMGL